MSDPLEAAKREKERTTEALTDAKQQLRDAMDAKAGPPAEDADDAQRQLSAIRGELERDLAVLRGRIPDTQRMIATARPIALAVGGGVATLAIAAKRIGKRREQRQHQQQLREKATALAESMARLDLDAIAAEAAQERADDEGRGKGALVAVALVAAGAAAATAWARARTREEPDISGPAPGPAGGDLPPATASLSAGHPATPADVTDEVPTIPVDER